MKKKVTQDDKNIAQNRLSVKVHKVYVHKVFSVPLRRDMQDIMQANRLRSSPPGAAPKIPAGERAHPARETAPSF